ncbi:MAG: hypothetical protein ACT4R6_12430 [Gemmatimonadaceae bacterium]
MLGARAWPAVAIVGAGIVGFTLAAAVTLSAGWPAVANAHDEHSLLLAADTFARGRLTNPTPPLWEHFETFHVLMQPSYSSKYFPAQGLVLALGQVLTGHPIVGVWIGTGLLAAALVWMLIAWTGLRWAVWGSLLVTLMLAGSASGGYWLSTYWGGTVPAAAAALVYGSVPRITASARVRDAMLFALGSGMLALSRPFEGLLAAIPAFAVAGRWLLRDASLTPRIRLRRFVVPCALVLAALGAFALLHNARVTGNPLRLPYTEYEAQYSHVPLFLFTPERSAANTTYRNAEMRRFYQLQDSIRSLRSPGAILRVELQRVRELKSFLAPGLTLILLAGAATSGMLRTLAPAIVATGLVLGGALLVTWFFPHYIAPLIAPWAILLTVGARRLTQLDGVRERTGTVLVWLVFALAAGSMLSNALQLRIGRQERRHSWYVRQDSLARALASDGRRHIVLVNYAANHDPDEEWVYNKADLSAAPVVWARALAPEKDARLQTHFSDRVAWRLQVDSGGKRFRLSPATEREPPKP